MCVCVCVCVCTGVLYMTSTRHNLALVQSKLMAQNVSLHSLLEEAEQGGGGGGGGGGGEGGGGGGGEPRALPSSISSSSLETTV